MHENEISKIVFDVGLKIHRSLGPGLLESAYAECLFNEISKKGILKFFTYVTTNQNKTTVLRPQFSR